MELIKHIGDKEGEGAMNIKHGRAVSKHENENVYVKSNSTKDIVVQYYGGFLIEQSKFSLIQ